MGPGMLLAYTAAGDVVATLDQLVVYDEEGSPLGLVDFLGHEAAGGEHTEIWQVQQATNGVDDASVKGSKAWPEYLGNRIHEFRVELDGPPGRKRIAALVHKASGHRRSRDDIEAAIAERRAATPDGAPVDLRDLVGGPTRHLELDAEGRTEAKPQHGAPPPRKALPLVARGGPRGAD